MLVFSEANHTPGQILFSLVAFPFSALDLFVQLLEGLLVSLGPTGEILLDYQCRFIDFARLQQELGFPVEGLWVVGIYFQGMGKLGQAQLTLIGIGGRLLHEYQAQVEMTAQLQSFGLALFFVVVWDEIVENKLGLLVVIRSFLEHVTLVVCVEALHRRIALLLHHGDALHLLLVALVVDVDLSRVVLVAPHQLVHHLLALFFVVNLLRFLEFFLGVDAIGQCIPAFLILQFLLLLFNLRDIAVSLPPGIKLVQDVVC